MSPTRSRPAKSATCRCTNLKAIPSRSSLLSAPAVRSKRFRASWSRNCARRCRGSIRPLPHDWHGACLQKRQRRRAVPGHAFLWAELTTKDFEGLDPEKIIAVLPVAATEQHGPHLPVMTDTAIAEGMIALLRKWLPVDLSVLVLPIQSIGKSNEHLLSPGTLSLSAETLQHVLVETSEGVHRAGLRKLILANSHGGNAPVLSTVTRELRDRLGMLVGATQCR